MIYGILLAAGFGRRYANLTQGKNKLLAPLCTGYVVAEASALALTTAVDKSIAVLRPESNELASLLHQQGCNILETNDAQQGMGASLAAAAIYLQQLPEFCLDTDGIVIALADMPWIKADTFKKVVDALHVYPVVAPSFQGKRGHPVGFQASLLNELTHLTADTGAKSIIVEHGITLIETNDPGVLHDIDTPADLII